jgi:serine/threonine-protein kinase
LRKVLESHAFRDAERLKSFLRYVVEETLAGRSTRLKEFLVGVDAFDKPPSFDPRLDPIVRVQARRLRNKLHTYYSTEGEGDRILIDMPKGSYVPVFTDREQDESWSRAPEGAYQILV